MDREVISRCIINILDNKHHYDYAIFSHDDMYDQLKKYGTKLLKDNKEALQVYHSIIDDNKPIIDMIVKGKEITIDQYNNLTESLRIFRRKYLIKK